MCWMRRPRKRLSPRQNNRRRPCRQSKRPSFDMSRPLLAERATSAAALVTEILGRSVERMAAEIVRLGERVTP